MSMFTLFLILMAVSFGVQAYLSNTYGRYSRIRNARDLTGAEVARDILDQNGLGHVPVEMVPGQLTDHYDPTQKVVRLSETNYNHPSLAALAVAAHEVGHAIQDAKGYVPLVARARLFPVLSIGMNFGPILIMAGFFLAIPSLIYVGIIGFAFAVLFHLITLPVEFDASGRALRILEGGGYLSREENAGARSVLTAAALTYVVGFAVALLQLLQLLGVFRGDEE